MTRNFHVFCIAGTNSGVGKTTITLGLLRALKRRGLKVAPFKCGPDYIDTAFHKAACGAPSRNLDTWMDNDIGYTFAKGIINTDCAVIEGVMGMFDGAKAGKLEGSTADVALKLDVPVLLAVNARGMAGSIAPIVKGYTEFNKEIKIIGVIANNVSSDQHASILKESLKSSRLPPLLGWLPRDEKLKLPERHLGLVPVFENRKTQKWFDRLADICEKNVDIGKILKSSVVSRPLTVVKSSKKINISCSSTSPIHRFADSPVRSPKIAIAYDDAFNFYYEDNFDALRNAGFEIVFFSPLKDKAIPAGIKLLYIGGGFPEVFAKRLSANKSMLKSVADFAKAGGHVFAECGGFMYLSENIFCGCRKYNMCGIIPCSIKMGSKLHSLGYRETRLKHASFLGKKGTVLRGHEFHWSSAEFTSKNITPAFEVRGTRKGSKWTPTGIKINNIIASYIHVHFLSNPAIAVNFHSALNK